MAPRIHPTTGGLTIRRTAAVAATPSAPSQATSASSPVVPPPDHPIVDTALSSQPDHTPPAGIDVSKSTENAVIESEVPANTVSDSHFRLQADPSDPFRPLLQHNEERDFDRIFRFVRSQMRHNEEVSDFVRAASHWAHINDEHAHRIAGFLTDVTSPATIRDAVWYLEETEWDVDDAVMRSDRDVPRRRFGPAGASSLSSPLPLVTNIFP